MTLPGDSIQYEPSATGILLPSHLVSGKEYPVVVLAEANGHLWGTEDTYVAFALPVSAVGVSKLHFDFFNATGTGKKATIHALYFFSSLDVAAVGAVATRMDLLRTTAIGTAGSAFATEATTLTRTIARLDPAMTALPAGITMREAPTGGATAGVYLGSTYTMPEESATSMGYLTQYQNMVPGGGGGAHVANLTVPENSGLRMQQGPVASVGFVGMMMLFTLA